MGPAARSVGSAFYDMNETVLSLDSIVMERGRERVLDGVSLDLHAGEALGLVGPNGAGKSTLIGIIAGVIKPTSGTRREHVPLSGAIAYVPQEVSLYPELTGRQNLEFFAEAYGLSGKSKKARVDYLLRLAGLEAKANKRAETYSGGMKRRLNMAAGLVINPKLLLLDEPTVGADAESVRAMLSAVSRLRECGAAVVLISHIGEDVSSVCGRVLTLEGGRLK